MEYKIPLVDLARQYEAIAGEVQDAVLRVMASARYIGGDEVASFEEALAQFLGVAPQAVISCASGTDALLIAYLTAGLQQGDEVIIPTHNYVAAAEAAALIGLVPVWADLPLLQEKDSRASFQIDTDPNYLSQLCSPKTKALVAVNMYGMPAVTPQLVSFCQENRLTLIEDNAQGMGGMNWVDGKGVVPTGAQGDISTTSFFPTKPLGAMGDGGAVIVRNHTEWQKKAREIAQHGQEGRYQYKRVGINSRLDALQAAILSVRLKYLPERIKRAQAIAQQYNDAFSLLEGVRIELPYGQELGTTSSYYQYALWVAPDKREFLMQSLKSMGIETRVYYPRLMHNEPVYAPLGFCRSNRGLSGAEEVHRGVLCLPIDPLQTSEDTQFIIRQFTQIYHTLCHL